MIESDHKSLEQISMKNLADAPVCLQRMLLRLQDYDFTIKYRPGEEMVIADTLSRYSPEDTPEILLDICQPCIHRCWEEMRLPTRNQGWPTAKCPCRHNHHWMARRYQGCSKSITTIPWTMWFTHCRGWTHPTWRSNHCSPRREEEGLGTNPLRTLRHIQVPIQG